MYGWEGDVVWLKTPDQACKRVRDADDEMRQVLQTQYECSCTVKYHKKIMSN